MPDRDELSRRLASLRPEQRRLLEQRLKSERLASVLERGLPSAEEQDASDEMCEHTCRGMRFSLFFFSADGSADTNRKYDLLLDCARFADQRGFDAVWTPERHFQDFGGLYPNPSVLSAALAVATERIQIRAGSVVLPLHHPIRIAEEWAVVDNLSRGRAAVSCATGWHPDDFVMLPGNFADRRELMFETLEQVRRLWSGEAVRFSGVEGKEVEVRTFPRPIQAELPIWITSSGNAETWSRAGEVGANILASVGSQPLDELREKIDLYRESRQRAGFDPSSGIVSVMLHTFIGENNREVKETVRQPMAEYLFTHMKQRDSFVNIERITDADKRALTELAFEHYFDQASLLGTPGKCSRMIERLEQIGVDDVACLVDFGVDAGSILAGLELLDGLRQQHTLRPATSEASTEEVTQ